MPLLSRCLSFLNGSIRNPNYLRAKASGFPSPRHPGNLQAAFSLPLNASIRGPWFLKVFRFPIKDVRHDGRGGFLSVSTRALNNGRGHALSFPMEGTKRKNKNMDSRLKLSGMTKEASLLNGFIIPKSLIPEWFYQESKLLKGKKLGFPPPRHPGNL
jgi:hypothetical protein